ncbi:hypothetical protein BHE74_00012633 [Ensete ventricosum]|nr:hypothetical protein GW17_00036776 [Ensete ventricosum]RWW79092.1 hypothetical protein BHE74_00012633 [Ensete ventricosum]
MTEAELSKRFFGRRVVGGGGHVERGQGSIHQTCAAPHDKGSLAGAVLVSAGRRHASPAVMLVVRKRHKCWFWGWVGGGMERERQRGGEAHETELH